MKNQILALTLGLFTIVAFGQKKELRTAQKAVDKKDFNGAMASIKSVEGMLETMEPKYKAQYYYLKAQTLAGTKKYKAAADNFNKLFKYEEEIGKAKYTKDAKPQLQVIVQKVSERAIKLFNAGDKFDKASDDFYLTYKLSPTDTSYLYNAAISASRAKNYDKSLKFYKELRDVGYTGIAKQYFAVSAASGKKENVGNLENQKTYVKLGTHTDPTIEVSKSKEADIIKNIAYNYVNNGDTENATLAIQEARKVNPKDVNLILVEADIYVKLKQWDMFAKLMKEAIELDPNNPNLFFNLGVVNQNEGKTDDAVDYYKKAIELKPDYGDAYMNLAVAILAGEKEIVDEMNKNLSNFKKYDELAVKQKALYKKALPYLEKADELGRSIETVKTLLNIYDILEMTEKGDKLRVIYKEMRGQ